ncbi:MAG TPA: FHA domain-containing protein, partial [Streptosporangiaceae bacterium]|nr:FHA domain-containing protein [Streptosporangiaceae bacterium]
MNALTLTVIRIAFLALLWLFVIAAVGVVRTDLFGTSSPSRRQARMQRQPRVRAAPAPGRPARPPRPGRTGRAAPQQLLVTA